VKLKKLIVLSHSTAVFKLPYVSVEIELDATSTNITKVPLQRNTTQKLHYLIID